MNIIKASLNHLNELSVLFDEYRRFYKQPADIRSVESFLSERLNNEDSAIFIAYENDRAAGFVQLYPLFSSVRMKRIYILNDLYVKESFRNKGIAKMLMKRAEEFAEETGSAGLMLETAKDNIPAQKLYESIGWEKDEEHFYYSLNTSN